MIRPIVEYRMGLVPTGETRTIVTLRPRDRKLTLRLRHFYFAFGNVLGAPTPAVARIVTDIPGLGDLHGQTMATGDAAFLPCYFDLRGDAQGTLALENLTGADATMGIGFEGYYLSDEDEETALWPRLESPSFVRASSTVSVAAAEVELLNFQTPNFRGGLVIHAINLASAGLATRMNLTLQGPGLESVAPIVLANLSRVFPVCLWVPPLSMVRVALRRESGGAANAAVILHGYGLP